MASPNVEAIRDAILHSGVWQFGNYIFASGEKSNNKFEIPLLLSNPTARELVLRELGSLIIQHNPDALWGVPSGGQELAQVMGGELDLPVVHLVKSSQEPGSKTFGYASKEDEHLAQEIESGKLTGIEDITTELTSVAGALELSDLRDKTAAIVAVWRRGDASTEKPLGVGVEWLVEEPVPNIITPDHPFYKRHASLAVH